MTPKNNKYFVYFATAFVALYITQVSVLNRFIGTNSIYLTGGTFIYFATPLISDVVAEVYGSKYVKQMIIIGCISMVVFSFLSTITIHLPGPNIWSKTNNAFSISFDNLFRAACVGAITIFIGQRINAYLPIKWQKKLASKFFLFRSIGSSIIGDSVTVVLSSLFTFFDKINTISLFLSNIVPELIVMVTVSIICSLPATYLVHWLYKAEGIDKKNKTVKFNPFTS